jgi:hypothetical protein
MALLWNLWQVGSGSSRLSATREMLSGSMSSRCCIADGAMTWRVSWLSAFTPTLTPFSLFELYSGDMQHGARMLYDLGPAGERITARAAVLSIYTRPGSALVWMEHRYFFTAANLQAKPQWAHLVEVCGGDGGGVWRGWWRANGGLRRVWGGRRGCVVLSPHTASEIKPKLYTTTTTTTNSHTRSATQNPHHPSLYSLHAWTKMSSP